MLRRIAILTTAFLLLTTTARANDFMFSEATFFVIAPLSLLWLVLGLIIRLERKDLVVLGPGSFVFVCLALLFFCKPEFGLCFWLIYLCLLAVYFLFPREDVSKKERAINLAFHGTFLALVVMGGIVGKIAYYSNMGGFARWAAGMGELYPGWLIFFLVFSIVIGCGFYYGMNRAHRMKELEARTEPTRIIVTQSETKTAATRILVSVQPPEPEQDSPAPQQAQSGNR